jgi:hypothetical protein
MSVGYASRLRPGVNYGPCGLPELSSSSRELQWKTKALIQIILESKHLVVFTGAGISTSCGIPDFVSNHSHRSLLHPHSFPIHLASFICIFTSLLLSSPPPSLSKRGPKGVWTLELKKKREAETKKKTPSKRQRKETTPQSKRVKKEEEVRKEETPKRTEEEPCKPNSFELAIPSLTHMALVTTFSFPSSLV